MNVFSLMPSFLQSLVPYESPRDNAPVGMVWLNTNEYPQSTKYEMSFENLNRYPEVQPALLCKRYAAYVGIKQEEVLITRGGDEAIELLIRTFCKPFEDTVLYALPTYSMYGISAKTCAANVLTVEPIGDLKINIEGIYEHLRQPNTVKVVFLCSPNNPTGEVLDRASIERVLQLAENAIVAVDEAYIEFCPQASVADLIEKYPNLAIVRTLSKAFALAGLRCGMILAQKEIIAALRKVIAPFPVPGPVAAIAEEALSEAGIEKMKRRVKLIADNRAYLRGELKKMPEVEAVYPSETNFLLFKVSDTEDVYRALWEKGIAVREPGSDKDVLRVSVGSMDECRAFVEKLSMILKEDK